MTAPDPLAGAATGEARPAPQPAGSRVIEGARLFRWLGLIGFGGPAAPIALMEDGVVRRRRWLDRERVLDLLGATDRIPGANSTALAIHVGYVRAGFPGLVVAGSCFILPGRLIVLALARASGRFSRLPQLEWLLYGLKPVIVVIVIQAVWRLGRIALATPMTAGLKIAVADPLAPRGERGPAPVRRHPGGQRNPVVDSPPHRRLAGDSRDRSPLGCPREPVDGRPRSRHVGPSGRQPRDPPADLPQGRLDPVRERLCPPRLPAARPGGSHRPAVGPATPRRGRLQSDHPGPVLTTASFIGYLMARTPGGDPRHPRDLPPVVRPDCPVGPWFPGVRRSRWAAGFLDGAGVASVALMAVVTWLLGRAALGDVAAVLLTIAAASLVSGTRLNSAWLVAGGRKRGGGRAPRRRPSARPAKRAPRGGRGRV